MAKQRLTWHTVIAIRLFNPNGLVDREEAAGDPECIYIYIDCKNTTYPILFIFVLQHGMMRQLGETALGMQP